MHWPFNRRRQQPAQRIDATGPATGYPNQSGALGPAAVDELQARRRAGSHWSPSPIDKLIDPWTARDGNS
ncbi:hypothetical protein [Micromonospora tarensis]|uniref:Uncharacterized protein n=1 Tax=Micromonospora tarensis TaxID=2806100 RepID=A0ABS1YCG9_9ACTN|nr:hypothetical protein [Micromonospora tarensis]MBM0275072.1 hypothetical protein [Micromonospora tarensis]